MGLLVHLRRHSHICGADRMGKELAHRTAIILLGIRRDRREGLGMGWKSGRGEIVRATATTDRREEDHARVASGMGIWRFEMR